MTTLPDCDDITRFDGTLFDFISLKNDVNVALKSNSRIRIQDPDPDPTISQRCGSEDPDPDPPQNVMDPQHWFDVTPLFFEGLTSNKMNFITMVTSNSI